MKNNYLFTILISLLFLSSVYSQSISEPGKLGLGFASSYPGYGLSAKYNFTETHAGQVIIGGASYGFGTSSLAISARYLYNFKTGGSKLIYKPYVYGQAGYFSVKVEYFGVSESYNTVSFGFGGGIELTIDEFVEGLAFNVELGYIGGSFDNGVGGFAGFAYGVGIHYYFDI
ncbi:hypothetical protein [Winogradskyella endarachnes]|uniref:Outer membrane beta-barrel protein n=1 Tax=Winogradskyella endarachnes TaxID=2681965 RepID=A0A6L6U8F0_9FLAO|nr:hypothetical protein [Winogradskyella endarachnes]MUU78299.1 hypothetical protein [Winogradskyella endarachnes]